MEDGISLVPLSENYPLNLKKKNFITGLFQVYLLKIHNINPSNKYMFYLEMIPGLKLG